MDKKGRLKNAAYVGAFKSLDDVEVEKEKLLGVHGDKISFQVYINNQVF